MRRQLRSFVAAAASAAIVFTAAAPVFAESFEFGTGNREKDVPVVFDALFLRPGGLVMTALGTAVFAAISPIVAITRPTDFGKPFRILMVRPARYTFVDPLGQHP